MENLERSGRLILAQPLQSATRAATLRVRNGKLSVTDGPFAETKEQIGGFFLFEAASFQEALDMWRSGRPRDSAPSRSGRSKKGCRWIGDTPRVDER